MLVYGKYEWFVMHMFHVCVLCAPCGISQCYIPHDFPFINAGRGCKMLQTTQPTSDGAVT